MPAPEVHTEWVKKFLSVPRFRSYVRDCSGDETVAMKLYWWNIDVSAAFYPALSLFEVILRNALHNKLTSHYARPDWWAAARPAGEGAHLIAAAQRKLTRTIGHAPTADDVVAAMSFGFWVSLLSRSNEEVMWRPTLYRAFRPRYRGTRREMHSHLEHLRLFRNRIMHHEPVHMRHLEADRHRIYELAEYLAPDATRMLQRADNLAHVLAERPVPYFGRQQ